MKNGELTFIGILTVGIIIMILLPFLSFWFCYFCGWIAKLTIGNILCQSLSLIGIQIMPSQIPLLAGGLGWIAGFFSSVGSSAISKKILDN